MAQELMGEGRVVVFPLLHRWPDTYGVGVYATTGDAGTTAVVGYLPMPEVPDIHFFAVAARHQQGKPANWVLCTGWAALTVPKPGSLVLDDVRWHLEVDGRGDAEGDKGGTTMYGHTEVYTGRFTLIDGVEEVCEMVDGKERRVRRLIVNEVLMKQAREVLPRTREEDPGAGRPLAEARV